MNDAGCADGELALLCDDAGDLSCVDYCVRSESCESLAKQCEIDADYHGGRLCVDGDCLCESSLGCLGASKPCASGSKCGCLDDSDCSEGAVCDTDSRLCVECNQAEDCLQKTHDMGLHNGHARLSERRSCEAEGDCFFPKQLCDSSHQCRCLNSSDCPSELACCVEDSRTCVTCVNDKGCKALSRRHQHRFPRRPALSE